MAAHSGRALLYSDDNSESQILLTGLVTEVLNCQENPQ